MAKKYHVVVFGCQMNISDSERVAAVLESAGYKKTADINKANIICVVMCSVRQSAVDRVIGLSQKIKKLKIKNLPAGRQAKSILTGCILKKNKKAFKKDFDYIIDIKDIKKLSQILQNNPYHISSGRLECDDTQNNYLEIKPKYSSKNSVFVPIMTGCNNFCSYCVVPYTRGREISRPTEEIICEVKKVVKGGVKEIWLLGQNVNSYKGEIRNPKHGLTPKGGFPVGIIRNKSKISKSKIINFPQLLKMIDDLPEEFELNFMTSHPKDFSDELIKTMKTCKKLSKRLNLPIQSGDDKILKKMNRPYTVGQYKKLVKKIRKVIPDIKLSTDVIVGFPGETKKQFENTVKTFREIGFNMAFVNKYSPRAGTVAEKLKDSVPWSEKKHREKILINLVNKK